MTAPDDPRQDAPVPAQPVTPVPPAPTDPVPDQGGKQPLDVLALNVPVQQGKPGADVALVTARRAQAVALRVAGLTYEQIAKEVGYSDKSAARVAVVQALEQVQVESVEQLRALEVARLDRLQAAVWQTALNPNSTRQLEAVLQVRRLIESRAKLLGLNAPLQVELVGDVDAQLGELRALMADDGTYTVTDLPATG